MCIIQQRGKKPLVHDSREAYDEPYFPFGLSQYRGGRVGGGGGGGGRGMQLVPEIHRPLALRRMAAAMIVPVPRGFVRMMPCPACIPPLLMRLPSLAMPVTLKPALHSQLQLFRTINKGVGKSTHLHKRILAV